jgi:hypothetical protein
VTLPPSFPPPARPDLADRLLAAVAERDQPMAERLVQLWVHRRGFAALEALMAGPLLASQGAEAAQWLQERAAGAPFGFVVPAVQPEPEWLSNAVEHDQGHGVEPVSAPAPVAVLSRSWTQLAVVPDGEPVPAPRALAPLRAWLPDADSLPFAS